MPDYPDRLDPFGRFDPAPPVAPLPPAEVRRRGDRRRRRARALTTVAAVAAVLAVATPVAVLAGQGDDAPSPAGPTPTTSSSDPPTRPTLADLPAAADLATFPADPNAGTLGAWQRTAGVQGPALVCNPGPARTVPQAAATYGSTPDGVPGGEQPYAVVTVVVAQFDDAGAAAQAYERARTDVVACPDPSGVDRSRMFRDGGLHPSSTGAVDSTWAAWSYPDLDACTGGCDATVYDRMGVAVVGDRVAWFSLRYNGGPLERRGADEVMDAVRGLAGQALLR
jgi:hypothetical protein